MKIINKINPRISAIKFKDEVRGFLTNNQLKNEKNIMVCFVDLHSIHICQKPVWYCHIEKDPDQNNRFYGCKEEENQPVFLIFVIL